MLTVIRGLFLFDYLGFPEPLSRIRVNEAHFFICFFENCWLWAYGKEKFILI